MEKYNVAILGATGAVGSELLNILESRKFPLGQLKLLAQEGGAVIPFMGRDYVVEEATGDAFKDIQVAFFAGGPMSKVMAPEAVKAGAVVIDNSSAFRLDPDVPLVVPEINASDLDEHKGIIANPNCSTIIMTLAISPIHQQAELKRIIVSVCQAVPEAGIVTVQDGDYAKEEMETVQEARKVMHLPELAITATTMRAPVFRSHSEVINLETKGKLTAGEARGILARAPGLIVQDVSHQQLLPMPAGAAGQNEVFVGRIKEDLTVPAGLTLWVIGDQIRKGAALNAVQIAEQLITRNLI
jgi:aspartate-semialdehyde dehydrogenase